MPTIVTGRNEVVAKVIFLHLFVILFTGGGLPQCMLGYHPRDQTPPEQTPQDQTPREQTPPEQTPPGTRPPEQTPPGTRPPPEQTPQEQTPPREADSSIRSTNGRYASYWNAFLLLDKKDCATCCYACKKKSRIILKMNN